MFENCFLRFAILNIKQASCFLGEAQAEEHKEN